METHKVTFESCVREDYTEYSTRCPHRVTEDVPDGWLSMRQKARNTMHHGKPVFAGSASCMTCRHNVGGRLDPDGCVTCSYPFTATDPLSGKTHFG